MALALHALATALAAVAAAGPSAAQTLAPLQPQASSPFQPEFEDPRNPQRFSRTPAGPAARTFMAKPATSSGPAKGSALAVVIPDDVSPIGFDSTGALRRRAAAKRRPGEPKPPPRPAARASTGPPQQGVAQTAPPQIAARAAYADAYKPPDAVQRRSPLLPEQDAFEPAGVRAGSFLVRRSLEVTRGYDSNPSRVMDGPPSAFTVVVPELQVRSLWSRDELAISLRGSYTLYDTLPSSDRPMAEATINRRFDVTRDTKIDLENRFYLSTDYPGSPNLQAGLAKLPTYMTYGLGAWLTQRFNRLELTFKGASAWTWYQDSELTDGSTSSNRDRDYGQYGGVMRASYEVMPGIRPFVEMAGDVRRHALQYDRNGEDRDSNGIAPRVGTSFELGRKLTGEVAVGYVFRRYQDPGLPDIRGVLVDGLLKWTPTGLTTATLAATTRVEESVLAGVSGALRRDIGLQIDHAFRRWLIGTLRFGYGNDQYVGLGRIDNRTSLGTAITYKLNREFWVRGEYRHDRLRSTDASADYDADVFLVGLKWQR